MWLGTCSCPRTRILYSLLPALKPCQLKPKRGTNVEPLLAGCSMPPDPKKLKRMKKKLDELNREIRHLRKKHNGSNSQVKLIEEGDRGA